MRTSTCDYGHLIHSVLSSVPEYMQMRGCACECECVCMCVCVRVLERICEPLRMRVCAHSMCVCAGVVFVIKSSGKRIIKHIRIGTRYEGSGVGKIKVV